MLIKSFLRKFNFLLQIFLSRIPFAFRLVVTFRNHGNKPVRIDRKICSKKTDIVIEGYPRCANTFTCYAILDCSQKKNLTIANHYHSTAQIYYGIKYNKPILILKREPFGAISSLLIRHPEVGFYWAIKWYYDFYRYASKVRKNIIVIDFEEVISNFNLVLDKLNKRTPYNFKYINNYQAFENRIINYTENRDAELNQGVINENMVARPSAARSTQKKNIIKILKTEHINSMRKLQRIYFNL